MVLSWHGLTHAGTIVFDDGLVHTVPGDGAFSNGDAVEVNNAGTGLIVDAGASVDGVPASSNASASGGRAIDTGSGTSLQVLGGAITGGAATGVGDANSPLVTIGSTSETQVKAFGGMGVYADGAFDMSGGSIAGGTGDVTGAFGGGSVDDAQAQGGAGAVLRDLGTIDGGSIVGGTATATNGDGSAVAFAREGLSISFADVTIHSGSFTGGHAHASTTGAGFSQAWGGKGVGAIYSDLTINGGTFSGGDANAPGGVEVGGPALYFLQDVTAAVHGGTFTGGDGSASGGPGVEILRGSSVVFTDGAFTGGLASSAAAQGAGIKIGNQVYSTELDVDILGGTFIGSVGLETLNAFTPSQGAEVLIAGGDFVGLAGPDLKLDDPITVLIAGMNFGLDGNSVGLGPVTATAGTLAGTLSSGESFEWDFTRTADAPLFLIPEPSTLWLLGSGLSLLLLWRRRGSP